MASRWRRCVRGLVSLALPCLFLSSFLYLSTRQPSLDIAIREEAAAGTLRVVVDSAAASVNTDANATTEKVPGSDLAAVANETGGARVDVTDELPGAGDAAATAEAGAAKSHFEKPRAATATAENGTKSDGDDTVVFDFRPYVFVYKSGRVHRFHGTETVPPGVDAVTGVESTDVAVATGVSARLYLPPKNRRKGRRRRMKKLPVLLYFHGGAFVIESPFSPLYHALLNILVAKAAVVAVSVNYRLAPEHPLPAAYDDAWAALKWTVSNCRAGPELWLAHHGDATRVFLAGDSSGGNMAHNLAVRAGAAARPLPGAAIAGVVILNPYFWGKEPVGSNRGSDGCARASSRRGRWCAAAGTASTTRT